MESLLHQLKSRKEEYWIDRGRQKVLKLFSKMSKTVPAYRNFLVRHKINAKKIKNIKDFSKLPLVDKSSYLKQYSLDVLVQERGFDLKCWTFAATSGTTGKPYYFPRQIEQDQQYAKLAELYLLTNFQIDKKTTLYIDGFAMGVWIGGLFTYQAIKIVAEQGGYPLSIITPGINKGEILNALRELGPKFDQIIIGGYPPFIKDVIDDGKQSSVDWKRYKLGFVFSAEAFNEKFRDYIIEHAGLPNIYTSTLNHYGTVDLGTMSYETPICILIRRLALKHPTLYQLLFSDSTRLPTLTQFIPEMFYFESLDGHLVCSAESGIPLVRYDLKDRGGVIGFNDMDKLFVKAGLNLENEIKKAGINATVWQIPFVYVYERSDMAVSWYGANIYPEHIKLAHQHSKLSKYLTGKFTMQVKLNHNMDPVLEVHSEMKKGLQPKIPISKDLEKEIVNILLAKNSEYKNNYSNLPHKNIPKIKLWIHESAPHFSSSGKQKWVIKNEDKPKR